MAQVLDTSDPDWWRVRCCSSGQVGFLPATHLCRLLCGERPHLVVQACSLVGFSGEMLSLHQDQVVICLAPREQEGLEQGLLAVRTGERTRGSLPARVLSEI